MQYFEFNLEILKNISKQHSNIKCDCTNRSIDKGKIYNTSLTQWYNFVLIKYVIQNYFIINYIF